MRQLQEQLPCSAQTHRIAMFRAVPSAKPPRSTDTLRITEASFSDSRL
jgi:hypothetical protein